MSRTPLLEADITRFCLKHLDQVPDEIAYPGGRGRKTVVIRIGTTRYAVSKRTSVTRAKLEAKVLENFGASGLVPKLIANDGDMVLQSFAEGERLTLALEVGDPQTREHLLKNAARGLAQLQSLADENRLARQLPVIGARRGWYLDFARAPKQLALNLRLETPDYDDELIAAFVSQREDAFVKWDARPGNALVSDGAVSWIDWEHCGLGSIEDDLVWLFADEWTPMSQDVAAWAICQLAASRQLSFDELYERFATKLVLHSCMRLGLIFRRKGDGGWWNPAEAIAHDRVGVSAAHVRRVCRRMRVIAASFDRIDFAAELATQIEDLLQSAR